MTKIIKGVAMFMSVAFLFTACATTQENLSHKVAIASDATPEEIQAYEDYMARVKKIKQQKKLQLKKHKTNIENFCFEDSRSIHYRAEERCK